MIERIEKVLSDILSDKYDCEIKISFTKTEEQKKPAGSCETAAG